jgi:hypothetical protein
MLSVKTLLRVSNFLFFPLLVLVSHSIEIWNAHFYLEPSSQADFFPLLKKVLWGIYFLPLMQLLMVFVLDYVVFEKNFSLFLIPIFVWESGILIRSLVESGVFFSTRLDQNPFFYLEAAAASIWLFLCGLYIWSSIVKKPVNSGLAFLKKRVLQNGIGYPFFHQNSSQ